MIVSNVEKTGRCITKLMRERTGEGIGTEEKRIQSEVADGFGDGPKESEGGGARGDKMGKVCERLCVIREREVGANIKKKKE